jgi:TonB family protein
MRNLIVASLVLSSLALSAQAATHAPVLQAKMSQPMLIAAAGDRPTVVPATRVSTGVVAPKLIHTVAVKNDTSTVRPANIDRKVTVAMIVDATGQPSDLKIVHSAGAELDKNVLEAVSQFRYAPGTVSNQPTAVPVNLEVIIQGR